MSQPAANRPIVAICYDFDKTLSPTDMQVQGYIQALGYDESTFWPLSNELASKNEMDQNLAYMYEMLEQAEGKVLFTKQTLMDYGAKVKLFPGVETWFERIQKYGEEHGITVEHYIISSGLKEMIEGTSVGQKGVFKKVYACSFYFNDKGVAVWPAQVINYTNKTQFLFRIEKGVLDVNDDAVNDYFPPDKIRVPFRNMVYIGDSDTDIPCMKLVNSYGGHSIGVYNTETQDKNKVYKMMRDNRIRYYAGADYSEGYELDQLVKAIIDRTATNEVLETLHYREYVEAQTAFTDSGEEVAEKNALIGDLEESSNFRRTHETIGKLKEHRSYGQWSAKDCERLIQIALDNGQVRLILSDDDLSEFYKDVLQCYGQETEETRELKTLLTDS